MSFLQDLHSAHAERIARLSAPLPGSSPRTKPKFHIIPLERGRQVPRPEPVRVHIEPPPPAVTVPIRRGPVTVRCIMRAVAHEFGVDITNPSRTLPYVVPRQIAMYLARKHTGQSLPMIGRHMGGYDHTTVLHGAGRGEHYASIPEHAAKIAAVEAALSQRERPQ